MYKILIVFLGLMITSCVIEKQGVFYDEMGQTPTVEINQNTIILTIENSNQNSALLIFDAECQVKKELKEVELKGYQALNKEFRKRYKFVIIGMSQPELEQYKFYWVDPDDKRTLIQR